MRFDLQRALPFLLLLFQGCGAGSLVPQLSITAGRTVTQTSNGLVASAHAERYALILATVVKQPPPAPAAVSRPPATSLPGPPPCLASVICGALERQCLVVMRRETSREVRP